MKILLTGATGYIGKRLLPVLVGQGHQVVCCVRDKSRFVYPESLKNNVHVLQADLLDIDSLKEIPKDIDGAYYLVHSMSSSKDYESLEERSAKNFSEIISHTRVKHVVYLSGIVNEKELSKHLMSRKKVEQILQWGSYNLTTIRAGIIIGSGSASFEIIRDLVEKLPIMITPKWLKTYCQPISVSDVLKFLSLTLFNEETYNKNFDVGGPDVLTYKQMLLEFARIRNLKRYIFIIPVMTPKLSSYWLYFVTSTSYNLATALVNSMKIEVVSRNNELANLLQINPITYEQALLRAFDKIEHNEIYSSWKDAFASGVSNFKISDFINVPTYGCFTDDRKMSMKSRASTLDKIWKIGGDNGWYFASILWRIRGFSDKLFGGVGLRRGRTSQTEIQPGDALDFWRVLYANKKEGRLLLFAEMKLPGEAWLEFKIEENQLRQTATFRPRGLWGRLYWYSVSPFHNLVFSGMLKKLTD